MATILCVDGQNRLVGDTPPAVLGKFFDGAQGILDSLDNATVKFTPPNQLNDGWDCVPLSFRMEDIEKAWQKSPLSICCPEQKQSFIDGFLNRDWGPFREQLSQVIGIASFTDLRCCDLEWMWNRYGSQHQGALVVYRTSAMGAFINVKYDIKRPTISIPLETELFPFDEVIAVFRTKERETKDHWEKECEWRKFAHLSALAKRDTAKGVIHVKSYPRAIKQIVCGRNMDTTLFQTIVKKSTCMGIPVEKEQMAT